MDQKEKWQIVKMTNKKIHPWTMDMWWELFSKIPQIVGLFWQMGLINYGIFGVFPVKLSAHILSFCVPSPWAIISTKTKILRHFKDIYIYIFGFGDMDLGWKEFGI